MRMKQKRLFSFLLALALIIGLVVVPSTDASAAAKVKKLSLTKSATLYAGANKGGAKQFTLKGDGKNVTKKAKWSTSNKNIATVKNGKITAKKPGVATISAKFGGKTAKIKVTVAGLSSTKATLKVGQTSKISFKKGAKAVSKGVKWASSNPSVVTVSNGALTAKSVGSSVITVKFNKLTFKCKVTVKAASTTEDKKPDTTEEKKEGIVISKTNASIESADVVELSLTSNGKDVTNEATWTSSDDATASIVKKMDNKTLKYVVYVTGQKEGKAKITATYNGSTATCDISISGFVASRDLKKEWGFTDKYVEFQIRKTGNKAEDDAEIEYLKGLGYTISDDGETASKNQKCETATYTFQKLPKTLTEIKGIYETNEKDWDVDSEATGNPCWGGFNAMAATICAANTFDATPDYTDPFKLKSPIWDMFDYINGPNYNIPQTSKETAANSMKSAKNTIHQNAYLSYFNGCTPSNGYTSKAPYVLEMYKGPYFIEQKETFTGVRPRTYMILVSGAHSKAKTGTGCESFDTDRYIDVYKSTKESRWCSFDNNFMHMTADGFKKPATEF